MSSLVTIRQVTYAHDTFYRQAHVNDHENYAHVKNRPPPKMFGYKQDQQKTHPL